MKIIDKTKINKLKTKNMNTYKKYCANVFVAKCKEQHKKGDTIILTTKYGKENEHKVHNFLGSFNDGEYFLYSITRLDGFNTQERAKRKAEKLQGYALNAENKSTQYYEASQEQRDFLSLGEPIKIGHHSEKRHRALIQRNWDRIGKSVAESEKAKEYINRAKYWNAKINEINLSMPESLNFFEFKLEEAKKEHKFLKDNPSKRPHSLALTYANKKVKDTDKNLKLAVKLWGTDEEIQQIEKERQDTEIKKVLKNKKVEDLILKYGGFFAFNKEQFKTNIAKIRESGKLEQEGEKVQHIKHGLFMPCKNVDAYLNEL